MAKNETVVASTISRFVKGCSAGFLAAIML